MSYYPCMSYSFFFLAIYHLLSCNIWVEFPSDIISLISLMPLSWHSPNASMYLMLLPLYSLSCLTFTMWDVVLNEHKFGLALSSIMFCRITLCLVILVRTCVLCSDSFACTCVCSLTMSIWSMLICYICHMPFYTCLSTTPTCIYVRLNVFHGWFHSHQCMCCVIYYKPKLTWVIRLAQPSLAYVFL